MAASNITLPEGTTNHGNSNLLCTPAQWYDVLIFFVTNYLAHAATTVPSPGQSWSASICLVAFAIVLPSSALIRAVALITRRASLETKNPLKRAARAGALCMVLKKKEKKTTKKGQRPEHANSSNKREPDVELANASQTAADEHWWEPRKQPPPIPENSQVHGEYWLHEDYILAPVPPTASLSLRSDPPSWHGKPNRGGLTGQATLISSQNLLKLAISLAQAIWAIITIYRSRGDQIDQYGYAAFGLTVVPFAMMSIMNALASLVTPEYPCLFVIRTPEMTTAERNHKAFFPAAISVDIEDSYMAETRISRLLDHSARGDWITGGGDTLVFCITLVIGLVPLAIVGGLTGFQKGKSSPMERGFTLSWLVVGIIGGYFHHYVDTDKASDSVAELILSLVLDLLFLFIVFGAPLIGGMVMVGKMIRQYGTCVLIE